MPAIYRAHRYDISMTADQSKLEQFLNSLEGEIVAIIPKSPEFMTTEVILFGLLSAVLWVYFSTHFGIPISASHALVGGLIGSAVAFAGIGAVLWPSTETVILLVFYALLGALIGSLSPWSARVSDSAEEHLLPFIGLGAICGMTLTIPFITIARILPISGILAVLIYIIVSPILGLITAFLIGGAVIRLIRHRNSKTMNYLFSKLQIGSAAFYSFGHGSNDAQNAMGVITATLVAGGLLTEFVVPFWVIIVTGLAMALGTFLGGWRVVETMGTKITKLRPYQGFCQDANMPRRWRQCRLRSVRGCATDPRRLHRGSNQPMRRGQNEWSDRPSGRATVTTSRIETTCGNGNVGTAHPERLHPY